MAARADRSPSDRELTLALVSARDGLLLVDEVQNGIHCRVQPDLWRLLFTIAAKPNVQVCAAFQQADPAHAAEGMLIRLERDDFGCRAKLFDEDDLATVTEAEIEADTEIPGSATSLYDEPQTHQQS